MSNTPDPSPEAGALLPCPLCGRRTDRYRMTINVPLGHACKNCRRVLAAERNATNTRTLSR